MATNEPIDNLPLAGILRSANDLVAAGLIEEWALGGALAAIYYVEPFTTYDADIFFIPKEKGLTAAFPPFTRSCTRTVGKRNASTCSSTGFPSSFWLRPG
jgi:hypothetical protein